MYELTIAIDTPGAPAPTATVIRFDLPVGGGDVEAAAIARGIRRAYRDVYDARVRVVSFQQTGLTRDVDIATQPPPAPPA